MLSPPTRRVSDRRFWVETSAVAISSFIFALRCSDSLPTYSDLSLLLRSRLLCSDPPSSPPRRPPASRSPVAPAGHLSSQPPPQRVSSAAPPQPLISCSPRPPTSLATATSDFSGKSYWFLYCFSVIDSNLLFLISWIRKITLISLMFFCELDLLLLVLSTDLLLVLSTDSLLNKHKFWVLIWWFIKLNWFSMISDFRFNDSESDFSGFQFHVFLFLPLCFWFQFHNPSHRKLAMVCLIRFLWNPRSNFFSLKLISLKLINFEFVFTFDFEFSYLWFGFSTSAKWRLLPVN